MLRKRWQEGAFFSQAQQTALVNQVISFSSLFFVSIQYTKFVVSNSFFFRLLVKVNALRLFDSSKKDEKIKRKHLGLNLKLAYKEAEDDIKVRTR